MRLYEIFYIDELSDKHAYVITKNEIPQQQTRLFVKDVFKDEIINGDVNPIYIKSELEILGEGKCFILHKGFKTETEMILLRKELSKYRTKDLSDKY